MRICIIFFLFFVVLISCKKQEDYSNNLSQLSANISALQKSADSASFALAGANAGVNLTLTNLKALASSLDSLKSQLLIISAEIKTISSQISTTVTNITNYNDQISALNAKYLLLSQKFDLISSYLNFTNKVIYPSSADLASVYGQLNNLVSQSNWFAFQEHSTDELIGPTRGTDWDDFGTWRKMHLHTVDASHNQLYDTWNLLNLGLYQGTVLSNNSIGSTQYESKFIKSFFASLIMDLYGQVPYTTPTDVSNAFTNVKSRSQAFDWIIGEINSIIPALPSIASIGDRHRASKQAAQFLKARLILNKAVYKANPTTPTTFVFSSTDMNQVIAIVDSLTNTGIFSLATNYWDNFKWNNVQNSNELIFTRGGKNAIGQLGGSIDMTWATAMGTHFNQAFSGWNGFATTAELYNSFPDNDPRKYTELLGMSELTGFNAGFLIGQQYKYVNNVRVEVKDRTGSPLIFTPTVNLSNATEVQGIRTMKYPIKPLSISSSGPNYNFENDNDYVFFRYADALLMKAEAILRGGTATGAQTALSIVNTIRARSGVTALTSITLSDILAERGRELYLEGIRRTDLIRFGVFNKPIDQQRTVASEPFRVVYPIPNQVIVSNPYIKQNFGY